MRFIPIYEPLVVKAPKNSPPHIAFEEVLSKDTLNSEWNEIAKKASVQLGSAQTLAPLFAQRVVLPEMLVQKTVERIPTQQIASGSNPESGASADNASLSGGNSEYAWVDSLPSTQVSRLQEAQRRSEVLSQDWSVPTWSDMVRETLEKSGALAESNKPNAPVGNNRVYVAATDSAGNKRESLPSSRVEVPTEEEKANNPNNSQSNSDSSDVGFLPSEMDIGKEGQNKTVEGTIEITGGLAVTNDHHIEIRRSDEGVLKELGKVDLSQGTYRIQVEDTAGSILARLVDRDGKIMGEGSYRLSRVPVQTGTKLAGLPLKIAPQPSFAGVLTSAYNSRPTETAPPKTLVTLVKGENEIVVKKDGLVSMDHVTKGSTTVMRTAAPNHLQTAALVVSGSEFKTQLYPESMIRAFQEILSQQRMQSFEGAPTIIWGRASLDEKPLAGITVEVEGNDALQAVYFNSFMIPDPNLKATSENGLYAFVEAPLGFQSLLAKRGDQFFGYQNVIVEENSVAQGDIESSKRTDPLPIRVYDAFNAEPRAATITLQSLPEEISVEKGQGTVTLPHVNRMGLMRVVPEGADFVAAQYSYNDQDDFIHIPLIHWTWLNAIRTYLKISDMPSVGTVVGFVPDENFEVYLAGYEKFDTQNIVYFDMQGRILQTGKGIAGGGFIIFNTPDDTHEVVVMGTRSQKMHSKVIPVDASSLSVLTFRE
ncbi:hypothetical protein [Bdellovibrio sp. HCB2-146]|uniref:hypothetical protein n=1 Tax=Bdellovibrio sp. HCB2-146 TaxID=3394362 RepID=UPI0039BCAC94